MRRPEKLAEAAKLPNSVPLGMETHIGKTLGRGEKKSRMRIMRPLDRTAMAKKYKGKWVALQADRKTVVASGKNVADVLRLAQDKGVKMPIITRMPRLPMRFIGYHMGR